MMRDNFNDTIENRNKKTCESHNENEIDGTSTLLENVFDREKGIGMKEPNSIKLK